MDAIAQDDDELRWNLAWVNKGILFRSVTLNSDIGWHVDVWMAEIVG